MIVLSVDDADTIQETAALAGQLATLMATTAPLLSEMREALLRIAASDVAPSLGQVNDPARQHIEG